MDHRMHSEAPVCGEEEGAVEAEEAASSKL